MSLSSDQIKLSTISGASDVSTFATIPHNPENVADNAMFLKLVCASRAENRIWLELELATLLRALKSSDVSSQGLSMKLSKKEGLKCLSFTMQKLDIVVTQDVPVRVLSSSEGTRQMEEPDLPSPDVQLRMPNCKVLKKVVDKMRCVDKHLSIISQVASRSEGGCAVTFSVDATQATIKTFFRDLESVEDMESGTSKKKTKSIVKVEGKKFAQMLWVYLTQPKDVWLVVSEKSAIVLYALLDKNNTSIAYYLPVMSVGDDDGGDDDEEEEEGKDEEREE